ncbi:DNA gyrase subunit A [bacterium]|uniref:DNA topoisomerase (ATP-hydrolyzing) n=1 Tax=candidate division WWE3 bacterium CG22_combo_CG10-13_8_21_14_all_39_12 TaxID=1975094 RepID=A0A2H0BH18_UNCKA|nr:DNA gyrase subunit A [bacterium]PIP56963.1 MAG: DNA gyrase subunit A [candidate division WWE3 bacterium CG22_combo_CG10-13_8_21_14_all_39_12]
MSSEPLNSKTGTTELTSYGNVKHVSIVEEMEKSYLDYAMSVIVARALPDVRDGLKPVQRRILYAMRVLGLTPGSAYKKSARIVGETIGKYHPHGDVAVYETMVRMAQDWSLRYPVVDGQGNFGSMDGDPPAAHRYTEARLQKIAMQILEDLDKNTVGFLSNFDGSEQEPEVLPAKFPYLLANGVDGIAVGMATKIAPHNLKEIVSALLHILNNTSPIVLKDDNAIKSESPELHARMIKFYDQYDQEAPYFMRPDITHFYVDDSEITVEDLYQHIPGPDFPTGGEIYDKEQVLQMYATGRGSVIMRAKANIVEGTQGKMHIEVTELPYQQNKALLITKIADLVKDGKISDISDLRDESGRDGLKIVVELKRGGNPQSVLNQLYKYTTMQQVFHANMVALDNQVPRMFTLKGILVAYLNHRQEVILRRTAHELINSLHRNHILEGLKIALDNLDEVIKTIRESADADEARMNLMTRFKLTEIQANAILEMQLRRLAALEREKILNELKEITNRIKELKNTLTTPDVVVQVIKDELQELSDTHGDARRTKVYKGRPGEISEESLVKQEETVVLISKSGYIKRVSPQNFRTQSRGGKGVTSGNLKDEDIIRNVVSANTHDHVLFFTSKGKVFGKRVWDIPESSRAARGTPVVNIIGIDQDEFVTSILTRSVEEKKTKKTKK